MFCLALKKASLHGPRAGHWLFIKRALAVNALEKALEQAATDPSHQPQFFRELMRSEIYVVLTKQPGNNQATEGLFLQPWVVDDNRTFLPFFSSLENLKEVAKDGQHAKLECRRFFQSVKDYPVIVLNPGLRYGKEFFAQEIQGLLDGSLVEADDDTTETMTSQEDTQTPGQRQVLMGQPKEYPAALIDGLKDLFAAEEPLVQAAYLAHVFVVDSGDPPHNTIGIQFFEEAGEEQIEAVFERAMDVQKGVCPEDMVDFVHVPAGETIHEVVDYLRKTEPFFSR